MKVSPIMMAKTLKSLYVSSIPLHVYSIAGLLLLASYTCYDSDVTARVVQ